MLYKRPLGNKSDLDYMDFSDLADDENALEIHILSVTLNGAHLPQEVFSLSGGVSLLLLCHLLFVFSLIHFLSYRSMHFSVLIFMSTKQQSHQFGMD